jgi:hypothetical protein
MSDLRTRIAAALSERYDGMAADWLNASWEDVADVVMKVLREDPNVEILGTWQGAELRHRDEDGRLLSSWDMRVEWNARRAAAGLPTDWGDDTPPPETTPM